MSSKITWVDRSIWQRCSIDFWRGFGSSKLLRYAHNNMRKSDKKYMHKSCVLQLLVARYNVFESAPPVISYTLSPIIVGTLYLFIIDLLDDCRAYVSDWSLLIRTPLLSRAKKKQQLRKNTAHSRVHVLILIGKLISFIRTNQRFLSCHLTVRNDAWSNLLPLISVDSIQ